MGKIILSVAISLDGFIADENGGFDWLSDFPGENYGMSDFFKKCGTAVMGSKTYEQALSFNSWFGKMEGIVFTSRQLPAFKNVSIKFFKGDPTPVAQEIKKRERDSWLVGGGVLIADFISHG